MATYKTIPNVYHVLIQDADFLIDLADKVGESKLIDGFAKVRFSRTSILLLTISVEALSNRLVSVFAKGNISEVIARRHKSLSFLDKLALTMSSNGIESKECLIPSDAPWKYLKSLQHIRNDMVHPRETHTSYYDAGADKTMSQELEESEMSRLGIKRSSLLYSDLEIPKDPYKMLPLHAKKVREVVREIESHVRSIFLDVGDDPNWTIHDKFHNCEM